MSTGRKEMGLAVLNGSLYVIGGTSTANDEYNPLNTVKRYNSVNNTWSSVIRMNESRDNPGVGVLNGKIYVIGGGCAMGIRKSAEVFDPMTSTWTLV